MTEKTFAFLESEIQASDMHRARFSVLPVPYEKTVSYGKGTALGPAAILEASSQLETWDGKSNPSMLGIHTCAPINCEEAASRVIDNIAARVSSILAAKSMPVVLGGEHTVTYGVIKGYLDAGFTDFGVVQIDAHADLREAYEQDPLSHASVMKRVVDEGVALFQLGVRAYSEEEAEIRTRHAVAYIDAEELVKGAIDSIELPADFPQKVFFTLDIDGMDPSIFPATGTPVPGGLGWYQTLGLFESVARQRDIIGFDIMEFSPIKDSEGYNFAAAQLVYKLMGIIQRTAKIKAS
jgi:agmatinase